MEKPFITTGDGCRIAYRFDGPEGAPVLLLSNSLGTDMDIVGAAAGHVDTGLSRATL